MTTEMLTEEDRSMIAYFLTEKYDVTRWGQWEEKRPLVEKELPELIDALLRLEIAEKTLLAIVQTL